MTQQGSTAVAFQTGAAFSAGRQETLSRYRELENALKPWCDDMQLQANLSHLALAYSIKVIEAVDPKDVRVEIGITRGQWSKQNSTLKIMQRKETDHGNAAYFVFCKPHDKNQFTNFAGFRNKPEASEGYIDELKETLTKLVYTRILNTQEFLRLDGTRQAPVMA